MAHRNVSSEAVCAAEQPNASDPRGNTHAAADVTREMDLLAFPGHFDVEQAGVFGRESINDYFATIFLPYVLQMLMFLITGLIVYEKQERLREIMLMSGLGLRTYWSVTVCFYYVQFLALCAAVWCAACAVRRAL